MGPWALFLGFLAVSIGGQPTGGAEMPALEQAPSLVQYDQQKGVPREPVPGGNTSTTRVNVTGLLEVRWSPTPQTIPLLDAPTTQRADARHRVCLPLSLFLSLSLSLSLLLILIPLFTTTTTTSRRV